MATYFHNPPKPLTCMYVCMYTTSIVSCYACMYICMYTTSIVSCYAVSQAVVFKLFGKVSNKDDVSNTHNSKVI